MNSEQTVRVESANPYLQARAFVKFKKDKAPQPSTKCYPGPFAFLLQRFA
jgi:hypothetical protein